MKSLHFTSFLLSFSLNSPNNCFWSLQSLLPWFIPYAVVVTVDVFNLVLYIIHPFLLNTSTFESMNAYSVFTLRSVLEILLLKTAQNFIKVKNKKTFYCYCDDLFPHSLTPIIVCVTLGRCFPLLSVNLLFFFFFFETFQFGHCHIDRQVLLRLSLLCCLVTSSLSLSLFPALSYLPQNVLYQMLLIYKALNWYCRWLRKKQTGNAVDWKKSCFRTYLIEIGRHRQQWLGFELVTRLIWSL